MSAPPWRGPPVESDAGGGEDIAVVAPGLPSIDEKVITNASIRLSVERGDFDETIQQARSIATSAGGFVVSSESSRPKTGKPTRGSIVVRVPEKAYVTTLASLESLGRLESEQESSTSVTAEYVDLRVARTPSRGRRAAAALRCSRRPTRCRPRWPCRRT